MNGIGISNGYDECKKIEVRDFRDRIQKYDSIAPEECTCRINVCYSYKEKETLTYRYDYPHDLENKILKNKDGEIDMMPMIRVQIDSIMQNQKVLEVFLYKEREQKDLEIVLENGSQLFYHGKQLSAFYDSFLKVYRPLERARKIQVCTKNKMPFVIQK